LSLNAIISLTAPSPGSSPAARWNVASDLGAGVIAGIAVGALLLLLLAAVLIWLLLRPRHKSTSVQYSENAEEEMALAFSVEDVEFVEGEGDRCLTFQNADSADSNSPELWSHE
jgi:hypothetical protein